MKKDYDFDYVVVGSGFGGSVATLRLVEKGYHTALIEMGRRFTPENMPKTTWSLKNWLWFPILGLKGFFGMKFFKHVVVLHGNALGGGSITYANTLLVPPAKVWNQGTWARLKNWEEIMPQYFQRAKSMLGVTTNQIMGVADLRLQEMAKLIGKENTFYPTEVGVFFGDGKQTAGSVYEDPYFQGEGPQRKSCIACGACMVGCRHGAKNTLDQNYLYLAEKKGAKIHTESKVIDIKPLGNTDGSEGYLITMIKHGRVTSIKTRGAFIAASSLGTQELLFKLREQNSLPNISSALGKDVRTNAESLIGVRFPGSKIDLSEGIAIGSGIYIDEHTHIEATRYPNGSDTMGLFGTVLTKGSPDFTRIFTWLWTLTKMLCKNPVRTFRALFIKNFAKESMIFLCMQTLDSTLTMKFKRRWFWPFKKFLSTEGDKVPTYIPAANEFAEKAAKAFGGEAFTTISEIFLNIPMTAHCIGGAVMASSEEEGVCNECGEVFNYQNLYICDGSILASNLGVNPSLTITAVSEYILDQLPAKANRAF